ncbi:MAG TPA: hypothetical protein HPP77_02365 [Candidatus Hydrogenedentes bacterium]|nr:hypothetical protein [Candidatus Hydrogenedentota bacterium]HIJ74897.1 hypothetical protein [Candidatus Hydrogenedentota bacterium]
MKRYDFGKRSGFKVPRATIGAMRLPKDDDEAVALIRHAIDAGMNYLDTSRGYGDSEIKVGKALKDGYREKVILSTKWAPWITKIEESDDASADCTRKRIEESMKRLDVDYLDYYQVWNIVNRETYDQAVAKGGMVDGIHKAIDEGSVGHTGFTTHDSVENLLTYIPEVDWAEIILFTYNLLNRTYAPAIQAAHQRGIGTIVMNPVGGGALAEQSSVLKKLADDAAARSVPDLALRYVLANHNVNTMLVGITRQTDVDDAVAATQETPFSPQTVAKIEGFLDGMTKENVGFCTLCKYCMPCPQEIDIPAIMSCIYDYRYWDLKKTARERYNKHMKGPKADACTQCGECEEKCTQNLEIAKEMAFAKEHLAEETAES